MDVQKESEPDEVTSRAAYVPPPPRRKKPSSRISYAFRYEFASFSLFLIHCASISINLLSLWFKVALLKKFTLCYATRLSLANN